MAVLGLLCVLGCAAALAEPPAERAQSCDGPAEAAPPTQPALDDAWSSTELVAPAMDARPLVRVHERGRLQPERQAPRSSGAWGRTTAALGGVVALIALLAWGYRAMAAGGGALRWAGRGRHPGLIEVVGRTALSPRQTLCLVRIGPRLVLLGVTPAAVRTLDVIQDADLTAQLLGEAARRRSDSSTAEFARCLEREAQTYVPPHAELDETLTPDAERIVDVKRRLTGTIARLRAKAVGA
jgi:flagellar biogenesis protein FliO